MRAARGKPAIWWIRRDLRLNDNEALQAALAKSREVIPLFIVDPSLWQSAYTGAKRLSFLVEGLGQLDAALRARGSRLIVRRGDPLGELTAVAAETGATAIFAEEDFSPYARRRDGRVAAKLPLALMPGLTVFPPDLVRKKEGTPYTVFTPYSKSWKRLNPPGEGDILAAPVEMGAASWPASVPLPAAQEGEGGRYFAAGEEEAQRRLQRFAGEVIYDYAQERDLPGVHGTSQLSPYLRFGMVSARQTAVAALSAGQRAETAAARKSAEVWLNELIWREFYVSILYHFPYVREGSFRKKYDEIAWVNDGSQLQAWKDGRTGYPIVDAAMRQMAESGWMHNRARMICASFLVKDLLIDWRIGEEWFMQQLVDGDPAANNGGWQWTAGTGTDAAPYFRIFNPVSQSKKFDPRGTYIRRWLPELTAVPDGHIHEPWLMPEAVQEQTNCRIGVQYPAPIVDHAAMRQRTLAAYKKASAEASSWK